MAITDTEFIFPERYCEQLSDLRGESWKKLVEQVSQEEIDSVNRIAFVYMIARINGCGNCNSDAFRAMKGCLMCARNSIKRFRGNDEELLEQYLHAKQEIVDYLETGKSHYR
jgi:hypothetical protein